MVIMATALVGLDSSAASLRAQTTGVTLPAPPASGPPLDAPSGWSFLPEVAAYGGGNIFHVTLQAGGGGPARQMQVVTRDNAAILTHNTDVPLSDATTLKWRWNFKKIPSALPETNAANHDYISIAVKFDNGQDLTYMWSAVLPAGTGFHCPLPGWEHRETHVVIRSGEKDIGTWLAEERHVLADYKKNNDGPLPARITQVWLIANSFIQKVSGAASFGDISLGESSGKRRVRIF